jgi:hypothetical protein
MASWPWLAALVPAELKPALCRQRRATLRRRREQERQERERRERWDRQRHAEAEARRRTREEEARWWAELQCKRERDAHERLMREAYSICYRAAFQSLDLPWGDKRGLPAYEQLRRDFPYDRPGWWQPPPGLLEAVEAELPKRAKLPYQEPDWGRWVPPYVPGRPWPWRRADTKHPEDTADAQLP